MLASNSGWVCLLSGREPSLPCDVSLGDRGVPPSSVWVVVALFRIDNDDTYVHTTTGHSTPTRSSRAETSSTYLLTDIKGETIRSLVLGGCKHHSECENYNQSSAPTTLTGVTYGDYQRVLVKAVVAYRNALNVIMLVDTGSPYTFLTEETLKAIGVQMDDQPSDHAFVVVNGQRVEVGISKAHFKDVDVLGTNFMQFCEVHVHYPSQTATVTVLPLVPPETS